MELSSADAYMSASSVPASGWVCTSPVPPPKIISSAVVANAVWNGTSTPIAVSTNARIKLTLRRNNTFTSAKIILLSRPYYT